MRRVVWFSAGAASACAAKLTLQAHENVEVVYCNTAMSEHKDNYRFREDCERWFGRSVLVISSKKYNSIDEVFMASRYMAGPKGARCTTEMKKIPRFEFQQADDIHIFGFTVDETKRVKDFKSRNPELYLEWPLVDAGFTKAKCFEMLRQAGIKLPELYRLGFKNNNCLGCVKATSPAYWNRVRKFFPAVFKLRSEQSRELGVRLVRLKGERIFLDELPAQEDLPLSVLKREENVSCGPECGQVAV